MSLAKWWVHTELPVYVREVGSRSLGFFCVVFGRADYYYSYLCKSLHLNPFILDTLSGHYFLLKTQGRPEREWILGQLQKQQQQCAALYQTRAIWKLESSKTL